MSDMKEKKIIAVLLVVCSFVFCIRNATYELVAQIAGFLRQDGTEQGDFADFDAIEQNYASSVWKHSDFLNFNGTAARLLGMRGLYSGMGMYAADGNYVVSASPQTSTDYEVEQMKIFADFLEENGIHLLYVNQPTKYLEDDFFADFWLELIVG